MILYAVPLTIFAFPNQPFRVLFDWDIHNPCDYEEASRIIGSKSLDRKIVVVGFVGPDIMLAVVAD